MKRCLCLLAVLCLLLAAGCQSPAAPPAEDGSTTVTTSSSLTKKPTTTTARNPDSGFQEGGGNRASDLPAKMYGLVTDDPMYCATVQLAPYNNRFTITLPQQQSWQPYGTYRVVGDRLMLTVDDSGGVVYTFRMTEGTLVFLQSESSPFPVINRITDGAVFF
ncbi:MAG: hypothetical protein IJE00_02265 [Clostridia bacterium]|nr:hypothetical protein [Clostridia bacterium]